MISAPAFWDSPANTRHSRTRIGRSARFTGAVSTGSASAKWTFAADAHLGSGDIGVYQGLRRFNYDVEGADVAGTFGGKLTLQLDAQQYDVDTTHGTLPKVGLGYLWTPHWQTTASYARSVTGNLGTELETLRIDHYGQR